MLTSLAYMLATQLNEKLFPNYNSSLNIWLCSHNKGSL